MSTRSIVLIVLVCTVIIISIQNLHQSTLSIFFWNLELPLIVLIFFVLLAGFTIGYTAGTLHRGKHAGRGRSARETDNGDAD